MQKRRAGIAFIVGVAFMLLPIFVSAAGLVPCDGINCQACNLVDLLNRVISFAIGLSIPISIILFAYAGVLYFTAATNQANIGKAKGIFMNVLVGLGIALGAYVAVETTFHIILDPSFFKAGSWNQIQCVSDKDRPTNASVGDVFGQAIISQTQGQSAAGGTGNPTGSGATCSGNCVALGIPSNSSTCAKAPDGKSCLVNAQTNAEIVQMCQQLGGGCLATAAIGGTHYASCQNAGSADAGTCIDMVYQNCSMTSATCISTVVNAASSNGLRAVYETADSATYNSIVSANPTLGANKSVILVTSTNADGSPHVTGNHFSVYEK